MVRILTHSSPKSLIAKKPMLHKSSPLIGHYTPATPSSVTKDLGDGGVLGGSGSGPNVADSQLHPRVAE